MMTWTWYKDSNTKSLFLHFLLRTSYSGVTCNGIELKKGQLLTSLDNLCEETGLSRQSIRTSMKRLKSTHEITYEPTHRYTIVSVLNWDLYQKRDDEPNTVNNILSNTGPTQSQHSPNTVLTLYKKDKKEKKDKTDTLFDEFYKLYPKKQSKEQARKSWMKLDMTEELFDTIMSKLRMFIDSEQWQKDNGKFVPMPSTWINNRRWEDEIMGGSKIEPTFEFDIPRSMRNES